MKLRLEISTLVLDGVDISAGERPDFQRAVEAELSSRLASNDRSADLTTPRPVEQIRASDVQADDQKTELARSLARAVQGGIGR